jgi:hypothetical protein
LVEREPRKRGAEVVNPDELILVMHGNDTPEPLHHTHWVSVPAGCVGAKS